MMPVVTVGIPFHNEERHLREAVESVLRQTLADFELLLVDDGSTDDSLAIARSIVDQRVRVIAGGQRRNLAACLNQIAVEARGEFLARMDADDICHPRRLAEQLALLTNGNFDAIGSWIGLLNEHREPFAVVEAHPESLTPMQVLERGVVPHPTLVASCKWFRRHPYDESLTRTEDRDLWCRAVRDTRFGVVRRPLYVLRVEADERDFVATYLETQRQNRSLFLRRGPEMVGWRKTFAASLRSGAKSIGMRGADRLGLVDKLVRRRGRPPTSDEANLLREALEQRSVRP